MPGESDPTAAQGWSHERGSDQSRVDKRPRPSSRESPDLEPTSVPSSSRSRPTLNQTPSLRGSSRDTNDMHRSTTPPEASSSGTIKYTRTGRVSKATKGQRVHHCEECGKVRRWFNHPCSVLRVIGVCTHLSALRGSPKHSLSSYVPFR